MATVSLIKLTDKEITTIAEDLDCGFRCFYHIERNAYKSLINRDEVYDLMEEDEREWEEVDENWEDYFEFEKMDSRQAFDMMEEFVDEVNDPAFRKRLLKALNYSKPFRNFRYEIDDSDYRQDWFDFKKVKTEEWVRKQVETYNQSQQLERESED